MTDGRIFAGASDLGSGFAVTDRTVVTARHVVGSREAAELRFVPAGGEPVTVLEVEPDEALDVAALRLGGTVPAYPTAYGLRGTHWRVTAQPLTNDPELTGTVTATDRTIVNAGGARITALQLHVYVGLGNYRGYSGSAVRVDGATGGVIGVLVEQVLQRGAAPGVVPAASNVLYAVPIRVVLERFGLAPPPAAGLVKALAGGSAAYAGSIANFLREYLGRPGEAVPFGGRGAQLDRLTGWLTNPDAAPYALVAAPAGRGKSALLVRWAEQVATAELADVVFVPVSLRFGTSQASVSLHALTARLAAYHGEAVTTTERSAEQWQAEITTYLERGSRDGRPLLVVLDGLDEATDWRAGAQLFPADPPPGLRVVVAARYLDRHVDEAGWRDLLNWSSHSLATSLPLPPLDVAGVSDVLQQMGDPLAHVVSQVDIVQQLHRLSEGDPLLVRLYVDQLRQRGEGVVSMAPEDLPSIAEGMHGYFDRWWTEQTRIWRAQGVDPFAQRQDLEHFLYLLACARGPLSGNDVAALLPEARGLRLRSMLEQVGRLVIGDGVAQGFVFSHPRFGMYFHELDAGRYAEWEEQFVRYGIRTLAELKAGERTPAEASPYVVRFHGAHLADAGAPSQELYALLDATWLAAWQAVDGSDAGFLSDCDRAWRRAESDLTARSGHSAKPNLAAEPGSAAGNDTAVRDAVHAVFACALSRGSVAARSDNIPVTLLADAVAEGVLNPAGALAVCRRMSNDYQRANALAAVARVAPSEWLDECLALLGTVRRDSSRAYALAVMAPLLSGPSLRQAVGIAEQLREPQAAARGLAAVASRLSGEERDRVAGAALDVLADVPQPRRRGRALLLLADQLPDSALPRAVRTAEQLTDPVAAVRTLCALARRLPRPELARTVRAAIERADGNLPLSDRAQIEFALAEHVPARRPQAIRALLQLEDLQVGVRLVAEAPRWLSEVDPDTVSKAVRELVAHQLVHHHRDAQRLAELRALFAALPAPRRPEILSGMWHLLQPGAQLLGSLHLLALLGSDAPRDMVAKGETDARALHQRERAVPLTLLARCHTGEARRTLLREALRAAQTVDDAYPRIMALAHAGQQLSGEPLGAVHTRIVALCWELPSAEVMIVLDRQLKGLRPEAVDAAVELCRQLDEPVEALALLAARAPADRRAECLRYAVDEAYRAGEMGERFRLLRVIATTASGYGTALDAPLLDTAAALPLDDRRDALLQLVSTPVSAAAKQTALDRLTDDLALSGRSLSTPEAERLVGSWRRGLPDEVVEYLVPMLLSRLPGHQLPRLLRAVPPERLEWAVGLAKLHARGLESSPYAAEDYHRHLATAVAGQYRGLSERARRRLLSTALGPEQDRAGRLRLIAGAVPEDLRAEVVAAAVTLPLSQLVEQLRTLPPAYPEELAGRLRDAALTAARTPDAYHDVRALAALAHELGDEVRTEVLSLALRAATRGTPSYEFTDLSGAPNLTGYTRDPRHVLPQLELLYRHGPKDWHPPVAGELYRQMEALPADELGQAMRLVDYVPAEIVERVVALAIRIPDPAERLAAWDLGPEDGYAGEDLIGPALMATVAELIETNRTDHVLQMLARTPELDPATVRQLRDLARRSAFTGDAVRLLLALSEHVLEGEPLVAEAVELAATIQPERLRDAAYAQLAPYAAAYPRLGRAVLGPVVRIRSADDRYAALTRLVAGIATWPDDGLPTWLRTVRALSGHPRPVLAGELALLAAAAPSPLPPETTVQAYVTAVDQVGTWWD